MLTYADVCDLYSQMASSSTSLRTLAIAGNALYRDPQVPHEPFFSFFFPLVHVYETLRTKRYILGELKTPFPQVPQEF
jgi:hypothetical protein